MNQLSQVRSQARRIDASARGDKETLRMMMADLRASLSASLIRCQGMAQKLEQVDIDQLMVDLRFQFDPNEAKSCIQDVFSDGFLPSWKERRGALMETLTDRDELPSGASK